MPKSLRDALMVVTLTVFPWYLRIGSSARKLIENGMPSEPESKLFWIVASRSLSCRVGRVLASANLVCDELVERCGMLRFQVHDGKCDAALQVLLKVDKVELPWHTRCSLVQSCE